MGCTPSDAAPERSRISVIDGKTGNGELKFVLAVRADQGHDGWLIVDLFRRFDRGIESLLAYRAINYRNHWYLAPNLMRTRWLSQLLDRTVIGPPIAV